MSTEEKKPTAAPRASAASGPQGLLIAGVVVTLVAIAFIVFLVVTGKGAAPASTNDANLATSPYQEQLNAAAPAAPARPAGPPSQMPNRGQLLPSGLRFETITEGRGPLVTRADVPLIRYELRIAGRPEVLQTTFDTPQPIPLPVTRVVPGFAEALTRMRAGGEARFWVPPSLGYGAETPPGAPFGPNDILEFRVRVERIPTRAELAAAAASPPSAEDAAAMRGNAQ